MQPVSISKSDFFRVLLISLFTISLLALSPQPALADDFAPEVGQCMGYYMSPINCTAQDVRIEEIIDVVYERKCDGVPDTDGYDTLTATFTILVSAEPTPPRYDIGIFMAKYGNDATGTGVCYQDYLAPTLTLTPKYVDTILPGDTTGDGVPDVYEKYPYNEAYFTGWWDGDGDACGDMDRGTQVFMTNIKVTVACYDSPDDEDTQADINMCVAWDEQAKVDCNGVLDATPATPAKCSCRTLNFPFTPTALEQMSLEAHNKTLSTNLVLGALGLLLVAGALGSLVLYRKGRPS